MGMLVAPKNGGSGWGVGTPKLAYEEVYATLRSQHTTGTAAYHSLEPEVCEKAMKRTHLFEGGQRRRTSLPAGTPSKAND